MGDRTVSSSKVSLAALTALGIGSMIGGGIFGLPQQMARAAAPGPLIIGWFITGGGMLLLAFVYQRQAETCSGLEKVSFCPAPRASMATSTTSAIMAKAIAPASATSSDSPPPGVLAVGLDR